LSIYFYCNNVHISTTHRIITHKQVIIISVLPEVYQKSRYRLTVNVDSSTSKCYRAERERFREREECIKADAAGEKMGKFTQHRA